MTAPDLNVFRWGTAWYVEDGPVRIGRAPTKRWADRLAQHYLTALAAGETGEEAYERWWQEYQAARLVTSERTGKPLR